MTEVQQLPGVPGMPEIPGIPEMSEETLEALRQEAQEEQDARKTELMEEAHPAGVLEEEAHPAQLAREILEEAYPEAELRRELAQLRREKRQQLLLEEARRVLESHQVPAGFGEFLVRQQEEDTRANAAAFCKKYEQALRKALSSSIAQTPPMDFDAAHLNAVRRGIVRR